MFTTEIPAASYTPCMPEEYYGKWERLEKRERMLFRRAEAVARLQPGSLESRRASDAWQRASERLEGHERAFGSN